MEPSKGKRKTEPHSPVKVWPLWQFSSSAEGKFDRCFVGLQPTVIASRAPHLLLDSMTHDSKNRGHASPVKSLLFLYLVLLTVLSTVYAARTLPSPATFE